MRFLYLLCLFLLFQSCTQKRTDKPRVLVFARSADYVHASIPAGMDAIQKLGAGNGFDVDTTRLAAAFTEDNLSKYAAVIFLNTTGDVLDYRQEAAFERYIQSGGGFVGIHAATDTEYDWGWYGRLVGAYFSDHPAEQDARFVIRDRNHPSTEHFADSSWMLHEELYNLKKINPEIRVLLTIDETSYQGGTLGGDHPMSWYHDYDGGRSFYTAIGHLPATYSNENYLKHVLGGIQYAIGENRAPDYTKAHTQFPPADEQFVKIQLAQGGLFYEPTELTVLPNLDVLMVQRRGQVLLYKEATRQVKQVGFLDGQQEISQLFETQLAELHKTFSAALDHAAKSAPAGSEPAFAAVKSAMETATTVYENATHSVQQLAEANAAKAAEVTEAAVKALAAGKAD